MIATLVLIAWLGGAPTDAGESFDALVEHAREHFKAGRYAEAAAALEAAYGQSPDPDVLFNWANAERLTGRCDRAIGLYNRYLEHPAEYAEVANQRRDECMESLPPGVVPVAALGKGTDIETDIEPPAITEDRSAAPSPAQSNEAQTSAVRPRSDALGWGLTGSGMVGLGTAGVLLTVAYARDANATDQPSHSAYLDRVDGASRLAIAGFTILGIGAAATIGGIVRLAVVRKHGNKDRVAWGPGAISVRF